jgi:XTP/dITP diphosphohydrolase
MKLLLATSNAGKAREFLRAGLEVELLPGLAEMASPEETGETFEANAVLKALYYAAFTEGVVLAEDSGLEVEALGGAPGVYSARYAARAGAGEGDAANNAHLLAELQGSDERRARYVAVIAVARGAEVLGTFRGTVEGEILREARGAGGFGYDPLFYFPGYGKSFGECSAEEKAAVSHRGAAIRELGRWLEERGS